MVNEWTDHECQALHVLCVMLVIVACASGMYVTGSNE